MPCGARRPWSLPVPPPGRTVPFDALEGSSLTEAGDGRTRSRYEEYVAKRGDELGLLQEVARFAGVERVLYPGSYVHITPSLVSDHIVDAGTDPKAGTCQAWWDRLLEDPGGWVLLAGGRCRVG